MGHATAQGDKVFSANDWQKFGLPKSQMLADLSSPEQIATIAQAIACEIALDRGADELKAKIGDCAIGAHVAGILPIAEAIALSNDLHLDPSQQKRIQDLGGLFVGAEAGLISLAAVLSEAEGA